MKFYNTLTKKIDEFVPNNKDVVTLYTCGPTVYHFAHIGNLRTYIMEDVLEKALNFVGYNVKRVMNITDVGHLTSDGDTGEDKMLKGAKREHKSVMDIAKYYTDCFKEDCNKLNIKWPETVIPATSMIDYYINFIEELIKKGYAYFANGNVYFDTSKLKDYYVLSNHVLDDLMEGVREGVSIDSNKKNKNDSEKKNRNSQQDKDRNSQLREAQAEEAVWEAKQKAKISEANQNSSGDFFAI